ncbi:outer membrane beta-barrel family protein [Emticicia agri]|uniref:TonB-dependent receptor n=1 Tax=Emticicia agri TaxID=2492393 RepID=A0A4Q5LUJ8_9BACT|nr:outer membrane beta-barrel family protein [Emticicia agri]RYU93361.1 TonB-dependent receptor [Emticicia agri]
MNIFTKNTSLLLTGKALSFIVCLCLSIVCIQVSFAQNAGKLKLKGKIVDAQSSAALSYASVRLFKLPDSSFVTGNITNDTGDFLIDAPAGTYYALLEFIGYKATKTPVFSLTPDNSPHDLGTLKIATSSQTLDEVEVRAEKSSMEMTLDKRVFNVGKDLANAGGTAVDILTNVPSVSVDIDGNVSLRGSNNVRILVDGKPSGLVSIKGGSGLQQLQGSSIERIEIITNPSARYEAEGMSGIINIILKKERKEGFNGSFDVITGIPTNLGLAANVNYRRKNLNFFVNYTASYRNTPGRNSQYQEFYHGDSTLITQQNSTSSLKGQNNSARAGIDYFFNENNVLTGSYLWRISKGKRFSDIRYRDYLNNLNNSTGYTNRTQDETETEPNSEYAISYKRKFDRKGHELSADVRYLDNWEDSDQYYNQATFKPDGSASDIPAILQRSLNYETEKQLLFQLDYTQPFAKDGKFELGARSSSRDMTNDFSLTQRGTDGTWFPIAGFTNDFLYEENINAAYGIVGNKVNKFSYQIGVRAEWTHVTTTLKKTNEVNPRKYNNLFPSVHLTYEFPKQNSMQISYSRRIRRPTYNDLSPFSTFSDSRNFWSGNPDLNPEFTDVYEIGHIKYFETGSISSSLYYRFTDGKIVRIRTVDATGSSFTRPENLATENSFGYEFTTSLSPYKWWKMDGSFNFFRAITNGANFDASLKSDTYSWFTRLTSRFTFWKNTDFQIRGNYEAPQQTPQGRRKAIAVMDLAVSKDILKNNATLTLNVSDVFNSRIYRSITEGVNFYTESRGQGRLRQVNLTFNYRLHQAKKKTREPAEGDF